MQKKANKKDQEVTIYDKVMGAILLVLMLALIVVGFLAIPKLLKEKGYKDKYVEEETNYRYQCNQGTIFNYWDCEDTEKETHTTRIKEVKAVIT